MTKDRLIISMAHDWAINISNSGDCIRCGVHVSGSAEAKTAPRCIPHCESVTSGYKDERARMIERVARAICIAKHADPDHQFFAGDTWSPETQHEIKPLWMMYAKDAEAAIDSIFAPRIVSRDG